MADPAHWDSRYREVGADSVSWHQERPTASLELFGILGLGPDQSVVDVGGGTSTLVDHLVAAGNKDVAVLDLSQAALDSTRARFEEPWRVAWLHEDVTVWRPHRTWGVWHDRAVLHFLTSSEDRAAYRRALHAGVTPGGAVIIGTFAEDGPTHCSGLEVCRYSGTDLRSFLGPMFDVVAERREIHRTPAGAEQQFNWIAGRMLG